MRWFIWIMGSIGVWLMFDYETLAFYVTAGLVLIVGSTIGGRDAADATAESAASPGIGASEAGATASPAPPASSRA